MQRMIRIPRRPLPPPLPEPAPFVPREFRGLQCDTCGGQTEHRLNGDQTLYECMDCGMAVVYIIVWKEKPYGI